MLITWVFTSWYRHKFFKDLRMEGDDIFQYQSVCWNKIWILNLVYPCWLLGSSSLNPLFFPISSPFVDILTTPKIFLTPPLFFFPFETIQLFNDHYPFLTDVPTHNSFLCREPLWAEHLKKLKSPNLTPISLVLLVYDN